KEREEPYEYRRDCCECGNYLRAVGFFWLEEEKPDLFFRLVEECRDEYPVLLDDCLFIQSYYQKRQPSPRQSAAGGVVNCWQVRPVWERIMGNIVKISKGQKSDSQYRRLCWFCSYNPNDEFPVTMRPVEQKLGKHGDWSKGKQFNLRSYAQDREWPSFFTLQDQLICNILADELNTPEGHLLKGNAFASPRALETAIGHPLLFWDGTFQHFECLRGEPSFWLKMLDDGASIAFAPQIQPGGVVVKHTAQDNLLLFAFDAGQTLMAAEIGAGLFVPENALPSITTFIRAMVQDISFFSEMSLLFTGLKSKPSSNELHVRLHPMDTRMKVELFLMPFPNSKELFQPGEGPLESVICEAGIPVRIVRDFELEWQTVREFLEECPTLADANPLGTFTWELESTESCLDFSLALQGMLDKIHVYWPDNKRFKTSRRLTKNDLSIHCRSEGDWLFSLDGSVTLDDGQVVAMKEMLKGLKQRHGNYIVLDDGQVLALADSFRSQLESIAASVSISDDSLHFTKVMTPFMRSLLQDSLPSGELAELDEKVDEIAEAMKLEPEVPIGLLATLRPYQLEGFKWLCRLDAWGVGACLADDMGLGKTVPVIAFMLRYASEGPMLVVAPTSVCNNWLSELERFAPSLDVCVFGGTHRTELFQDLGPNMVMITSYGLLQSEEKSFCAVKWRCVVLDEAQAIKNHNTKRAQAVIDLNAKFRMVTTGTPLENNLNELWSIFNFVNPGLLDSHSHFQERFAVPIEAEKDKEALERLSNIVKPFILRRLKREVLQELPQKTEISLQVSLSEEESAFYEALRSELLDEIHRINDDSGRLPIRVIAAITKLRLAVCNSKLIDPPPSIPIPSSKMEAFLELLDELLQAHHKILVFSQFVKHLKLVENEIQKRGIAYQYLDGDMNAKERTVAVNAFQRGKGDVFLISLRAGGMGLNLTAADYVIHLDPWWNPA
ncbi:MAG: hypothetical protein IKR81_17825, partial [Victivallales bacterium]|nr:hypothetical protein [Victivallales bacterium]